VRSANDRIAEAISVIRDEWAKMATEGLTEQELQDAKTYITGAYPLRFDGNGPIANILVGMQQINLPIDYIPTRNDKVERVTIEDVKRVAAYLLDPDAFLTSVAAARNSRPSPACPIQSRAMPLLTHVRLILLAAPFSTTSLKGAAPKHQTASTSMCRASGSATSA
jgi:hypothetical protein